MDLQLCICSDTSNFHAYGDKAIENGMQHFLVSFPICRQNPVQTAD